MVKSSVQFQSVLLARVVQDPPMQEGMGYHFLNWDTSLSGKTTYGTRVEYGCEDGKDFADENGNLLETTFSESQWNKTWFPTEVSA